MGSGIASWLHETRRTYFGNAAAQRDFRVQLRGNRSVLLFGVYLTILIWVAYLRYSSIQTSADVSVVYAQRQLTEFYQLVVSMLAGMVAIVSPGLAATTVVTERQRRSLDLVFSAPVQPRYYLVGKTIAVYRYIWMLLILSLPVTATCVVLGGASWIDVLTVYALLSIHGLLFAAFGLMMSTVSEKPLTAILYTYISVALYLAITSAAGSAVSFSMTMATGGEKSIVVSLSPFLASTCVGTYTTIAGAQVPNWILGTIISLWIVRLCLLGAGALLSEGRETVRLRMNWAVTVAVVGFISGLNIVVTGGYPSAVRTPPPATPPGVPGAIDPFRYVDGQAATAGILLFWLLSPMIFAIAKISAFGEDGFIRQRFNGWFSWRNMLDGTPAGGLPYLTLMVALAAVSLIAGVVSAGGSAPGPSFLHYVLYVFAFWSAFWAVTRLPGSLGTSLKTSSTTYVIIFVVVIVLPAPFLSALAANLFYEPEPSIWDYYVLRPVLPAAVYRANAPLVWGLFLLIVTALLHLQAETYRRRRLHLKPQSPNLQHA